MCTQAVYSLSMHEGTDSGRAAEGRFVSVFPPSLPVSNHDKSSISKEALPS